MEEVHGMKTPPLPSPAEAPSPVVAPQSYHRFSSHSVSSFAHSEDGTYSIGGRSNSQDNIWKANSPRYSVSPEQFANHHRIPASIKKENLDARNGLHEDLGRNQPTLKDLRQQMEELLAYQQMRSSQNQAPSLSQETAPSQGSIQPASQELTKKRRISNVLSPQVLPPLNGAPDSAGSSGTIRGTDSQTTPEPLPERTPSYPFPAMPPQSTKQKLLSQLNNGSFKLTLPAEKLKGQVASSQIPVEGHPAPGMIPASHSAFLPPDYKTVIEDPVYPSPNLYELTLQLNADPGLDSWWTNVVDILRTHYGVERASLALPGDSTDLENVPWGQKAIFNENFADSDPPRRPPNEMRTTDDIYPKVFIHAEKEKEISTVPEFANKSATLASSVARPPLSARHSFAGFGKERKKPTWNEADASLGTKSSLRTETPLAQEQRQNSIPAQTAPQDISNSSQPNERIAVFPTSRALEVEPDPLIKRTGVVKLFGRTKPVILTREYSHTLAPKPPHEEAVQTPEDKVQITPTAEPSRSNTQTTPTSRNPGASVSLLQAQRLPYMEFLDEYEQVPPSPWSQSPAPSPAPRAHPEQNPFFSNHTVDESAFAKHPPLHDYSNPDPLEAIGVDLAKSVVHIPLLHIGPSKQSASSPLRFPIAVISILSSAIPYPTNLRQSLAYLMPHLTTSFCLAQHYSQLERQIASRLEPTRFGNLLGLGGTFSDESSELELVAGLSGHVSYTVTDDGSLSARASLSSPDDRASSARFSPSLSTLGTPYLDLNMAGTTSVNMSESPGLAARLSGNEPVDSYFNVPQSKASRDTPTQHRSRLAKIRQAVPSPSAISPGRAWTKSVAEEEGTTQDPSTTIISPQETKPQPLISPTQTSSRHHSNNSFYTQFQRDLPRPFNDTVAQLMLNSIPLHLFLAKPQSGEVIWTNSKFDAYRRSQHQDQKLRDPWQNIHNSERGHVAEQWANALRTGSQFTERVRVKRFNDESAYRWFIFRANPLLSTTGEVLYWIGSFLDIHEQHVTELKAAQEREKFATDAKYRAFSNSVPQIVFEATESRGLIFVNEQWHLYTGQNLEDSLNFGFAKQVHHDDLEKCGLLSLYLASGAQTSTSPKQSTDGVSDTVTKVETQEVNINNRVTPALDELVKRGVASVQRDENGRTFYSTEIRLRSRGGDFRWHLVRLVRVETSSFGSDESSWYGTCTDINDRKNLERELNKAMQQLNNQMESKTKFFSNMSHEIRTPLNGILGTIPFILDTSLDTDQRRMLDTIQNSSTNLRELVDNILDVSRVEAGKMSLVNSWFHVRSVIEDVIDTVSSRAIDKGLEMNYLMDVDVPQMVIGDRFRIRQVLINLVGNAVKFTASGEIHIRCSIYRDTSVLTKSTETLLNFDVVDTGKGFSVQDAERLMQRFSQLGQNASQQNAGSGLGLFLSKQLVEMHGGRLTPSSKEGQGAQFSFYVKVDAPPPPAPGEGTFAREQHAPLKSNPLQKLLFSSKDSRSVSDAIDLSALESSLALPPTSGDLSSRFASGNLSARSSFSSALPTPDLHNIDPMNRLDTSKAVSSQPDPHILAGHNNPTTEAEPQPLQSGITYSIVILCPLENTRKAITQHIEQVVPYEIQHSIMSFSEVEDWKDSVNVGLASLPTHLVLNLPNVDEVVEVIDYVAARELSKSPTLVIISELYQKRRIGTNIKELSSSGRHVFMVPKPVKPSAFSPIFDPGNRRDLSKDRNQDTAREINNNFKTMSKMVKEVIGNKGYRVLLVEDDETNRMVMMKYLDKIKVIAETAGDGQQCTDMVFSKEPGYYSLIICDIQMPIKNGYDTCRDIRGWESKNHYPQIPIMALSANAMNDQIEDAARAGFNDYVTKPIKHNELGKMMMGLLDPARPLLLLRDRLKEGAAGSPCPE